jgi:outer membrane protein TolC
LLADLAYETYPTYSRIILASNQKLEYISYELDNPYRIVIDLVGFAFCELEQRAEYDQGLVHMLDIVQTPYVKRPQGLDEFFYAVDYVMITPTSKLPYTITQTADGRIIFVDIGKKPQPAAVPEKEKPVSVYLGKTAPKDAPKAKPKLKEHQALQRPQQPKTFREIVPEPFLTSKAKEPIATQEALIDYVHYEILDDASLLIISSNQDVEFDVTKRGYSPFNIVLRPTKQVFSDLENKVAIGDEFAKTLKIVEDKHSSKPDALDEYYYPVKDIILEPNEAANYDFYTSADGTIAILELFYPEGTARAAGTETAKEQYTAEPTEERLMLTERRELLKEFKEEIKKQGLLKQEKLQELRTEEEEKRKLEAAHMAESIGKKVLEDMVVKGKGIFALTEAQLISMENHPRAATAKEEIGLAKLKRKEAFRALFPNVKLKGSYTEGDVLGVDFIEEVYGVQGEHPIYQGGRLVNTYKQSKVNLRLAEARYRKIENDSDFKVAEAYYNTVTAVMNLNAQRELLKESERIVKTAEERHRTGLSTTLEILNVQSRYNQIKFQIATAERDLALARFKLEQAMNLDVSDEPLDLSEVDTQLPFKVIDVDMYQCLELASDYQPDLEVNQLLVESNEYNEKIAKGKESFKVDLTGFYGKSGSHYETEDRELDKDWNIGVKVSKPFWGNTANYSFTKEETSRKVGQTDRTGSTVHAGEFAIYDKDSLSVKTEIKEAKVGRRKAEDDLIESRRQVALEVKEAYYNYQESVLQVKNALEKVRFQEEAVKVAKAQAELNEALQSQLLEALIKRADERALYVKALSDYNLALVKLNKAVGIRDYFSIE